ncbi:MAG: polyprenyl synthetase family protein [Proteobacteria bacterium]|nr:polyprenyl synthetase family protein [Pseudomonadota bacterium]
MDTLRSLICEDMGRVDSLIQKSLQSDVILINQVGHHIVNSGGKRLRPALLLLVARHFAYSGSQHINLAAIIEFIHTATLLHDDVVDASLLRRGQETANQRWGNEASVLVGDFLYSRAFQMMVDTNSMRVMDVLSKATNAIAEGEVQQLLNIHDPEITEINYIDVIQSKTAKLFEAAGRLGAILCERKLEDEQAMAKYGMHLGTAFQLIDDVLDYNATNSMLGKNIGDDLAEGKPTLPLLYAMWNSEKKEASIIREAIISGDLENIELVQQIINMTGAIEYTTELAQKEADLAIKSLDRFSDTDYPSTEYLDAMVKLARFSVARKF